MRTIDADVFKEYIDAQEGRPFIGCTGGNGEFMEQLKAAGYECWEDDVVMIKIDYRVQSEAELRRFVKDVLCWPRSWGIFFEPKKPDGNAEPAQERTEAQGRRKERRTTDGVRSGYSRADEHL